MSLHFPHTANAARQQLPQTADPSGVCCQHFCLSQFKSQNFWNTPLSPASQGPDLHFTHFHPLSHFTSSGCWLPTPKMLVTGDHNKQIHCKDLEPPNTCLGLPENRTPPKSKGLLSFSYEHGSFGLHQGF